MSEYNPNTFWTSSKNTSSKQALEAFNGNELKNISVGDKFYYVQSDYQIKREKRNEQRYNMTPLEWCYKQHGVSIFTQKFFVITNIKKGVIPGIDSKFNGNIVTLLRIR